MEIDYIKDTAAQILIKRFKACKQELKTKCIKINHFKDFVFEKEPAYNTADGIERIKSAWYCYSADVRLTELVLEFQRINLQ
jgi:hypothetical protein